ncbi:uncharacterized protein LOC114841394 [Diachasma alloeum]|uniref:uncharacterized protein LOC114841394 n=1 Tax=Diachasma alloeum TaxID=454923 RepID=UPI0010FB96EE|nr:uncharacterized protein LOC114841394 [Diachasma alloeum]
MADHCYQPSKSASRHHRQGWLLDRVHQRVVEERISCRGSEGVLLIDGWTNSSANTKNVVCTIHTVNSKSIFLKSWDLTGIGETADQLKNIVEEGIDLAKVKFNITIYAVVSDNASAMVAMGNKVNIWHTTCHSHSGNLLAKALVLKELTQKVNKLLREFKAPGAEHHLKKLGGSRIILAGETRWCSYRDAFRCLSKNLHFMKTLIETKTITLSKESETLLRDPSFECELLDNILIFDPICELMNVCQGSHCSLSEGCEEWLKLAIPTVNNDLQELLEKRFKKVLTPIMLTSNFLNPKYRGKRFINDEEKMAMVTHFIMQELNLDKITKESGFFAYQNNTNIFKKLMERNMDQTPETLWTTAAPFYPELSALAVKLLRIPAASAQLERLFSSWAFVHSDLRNRLTVDRSMKLVDIYYSLKMNELYEHCYDDLMDSD